MEKHLKELPPECDQALVRRKLDKEYRELENMLRSYLKGWCQPAVSQQQASTQPVEENPNRELVYVGPTRMAEGTINPSFDSDLSCSMSFINEWVSLKRQTIVKMLQEESPNYEAMQLLLEQSLQSLRLLIEPQLQNYQALVNEVRWKRVNHKEAVKESEVLHTRLVGFFRQSVLLFHPDQSSGNEHLTLIKTELFKKFQQFTENSLEKLNQGLKTLKRCIPKWELDLDKMLEKIERDRIKFKEQFDQKYDEIKAQHAEIKAAHIEIKAEHAEIKATQDKIKIALNNILSQLNAKTARNSVSEEHEQTLEHTRSSPSP